MLKEMFRILKSYLRSWSLKAFEKMDLEIKEDKKNLNEAYALLSYCMEDQVKGVVAHRTEATRRIWLNMKIKENTLLQKSRLKWNWEGDMNSIFSLFMKSRHRSNFVGHIQTEEEVVESVIP